MGVLVGEPPENGKANFDIWARAIERGKAGRTVQISHEPGSDIDPAATTDSQGRVWVAWQGWRNGKASIFAATEDGDRFSRARNRGVVNRERMESGHRGR